MHDWTILLGFWWLIFPLMGFFFGGFGMFLNYRRSQQALEIIKAYAAQGKDPPPEVMAAVTGIQNGAFPPGAPYGGPYNHPYNNGYGPGAWGGWGWGNRWAHRGPMWAWGRVVMFAAIAIGFGLAGQGWHGDPDANEAFHVVAVIMGVVAVGFGFMALMHTLFYRAPKP